MLHAVIMAGGAGTRFWPESRRDRPKQLLNLVGSRTMLQATVDRLGLLTPPERLLIVTAQRLVGPIAEQLPDLAPSSILGEPCKRDTAPCIGLAAFRLLRRDPEATMVVMPSDHLIGPDEAFRGAIRVAAALVKQDPRRLVTFGVHPTYPAESFGYIERGEAVSVDPGGPAVHRVAQFREKPKPEVARQFLAAGTFLWNAGIFVWKARTILDELTQNKPDLVEHLKRIDAAEGTAEQQAVFEREFAAIQGVSIDYAVMEQAREALVIEAPFTWDDVGSWQAIGRIRGADAEGNTIVGKHLGVETRGTIVRTSDEHLVVTLGVEDCVIVHTPDATLVANRHDEEAIRRLASLLEERGWSEYL